MGRSRHRGRHKGGILVKGLHHVLLEGICHCPALQDCGNTMEDAGVLVTRCRWGVQEGKGCPHRAHCIGALHQYRILKVIVPFVGQENLLRDLDGLERG